MPSPGGMLRQAMADLLGHRITYTGPTTPGYQSLRELYGSNAAIASAAGYETAAEAKKANRDPAVARRKRQSFLRNLQRYQDGTRTPKQMAPLLDQLEHDEIRRRGTFRTFAELAAAMHRLGVTVVAGAAMTIVVSSDERERYNLHAVAFWPSMAFVHAVEATDWGLAAERFFEEWGRAYGIGRGVIATDVDVLELHLGIEGGAYMGRAA